MTLNENRIIDGAKTAFIDKNISSDAGLKPKLIHNNNGEKVLNYIKEELSSCDEFFISVSFIRESGIQQIIQDLDDLSERGIQGRILTTDYMYITQPKSLKTLMEYPNIEVRMYRVKDKGFHTKGYFFKKENNYKAIVGSSNISGDALTKSEEWNIGFSSLNDGEIIRDIINKFNELWDESSIMEDIFREYENNYDDYKNNYQKLINYNKSKYEEEVSINPNTMQEEFLENLKEFKEEGEDRALLVSATGTGKTYAAAFSVNEFKPNRLLFIAHREQLLKQAINSFKKILTDAEDEEFSLIAGNQEKDFSKKYLFATVQTLSKDEYLYDELKIDDFDYIIIDEVHRAGSYSYKKIFDYFKPKFWLGMTASPERTDEINIFELFNFKVAQNIRLQKAMELDLLCPFHYYGISDFTVAGKLIDDHTQFNDLVTDDRVNYLIEKSEHFGYSGENRKCLVFCRSTDEAIQLARKFDGMEINGRKIKAKALSSRNSQETREKAIKSLISDEEGTLEFIFTVDIFNEGVDIPEVNQIILIRPTKSPIIFIQQLGRGLRKSKNKDYVVIIDFIGNYRNNFFIPIALSGDKTYNNENLRKYLIQGSKFLPGESTINFDSVSKERIFKAITSNFSNLPLVLYPAYNSLKKRLGKIPSLNDFYEEGELDPSLILNHQDIDCYHSFLVKADEEYKSKNILNEDEIKYLKFITDIFSNGKRPHELLIIKLLIENKFFTINILEEHLKNFDIENDLVSIESSFNIFNLNFFKKSRREKYDGVKFFEFDYNMAEDPQSNDYYFEFNLKNRRHEEFKISAEFNTFLEDPLFFKHINDLITYSLKKYENTYKTNDIFKLYEKYSRKDACRLLNWPQDDSSTMYGYRVKHDTCPIFVTYEKQDDISDSTKYPDKFLSNDTFSWLTRNKVSLRGKEVKGILDEKTDIRLFVKKSDFEDGDFYYMGKCRPIGDPTQKTIDDDEGNPLKVVKFEFNINPPVENYLYDYILNDK